MEFVKITKDRYMIKDSYGRIVDEKTKLKLEKKELVLEDIYGCDCQEETTKKIKKINKKIGELNEKSSNLKSDVVKETTTTIE